MSKPAPIRKARGNEAAAFQTADGKVEAALVKNADGAYRVFLSSLQFDEDEQLHYWSDHMMPTGGIYETVEIAKAETETVLGPLFATRDS